MRSVFTRTMIELAEEDPRVVLLTADLGYSVLEPFMERFPDRFFNVGVAEQNMVGVATGLAEAGFIPYVYSIVTFAALRPYEFIRNGPVLHQLPVRVIAVGGGVEYGTAGPTHHGLEDVGVMRMQPGLTVIVPADPAQAHTALRATWNLPGPVYYRLGKNDKHAVPELGGRFRLARAEVIFGGSDLLLVAMGPVASEAVAAACLLSERGIEAKVAVIASLNPPPIEDLVECLAHVPVALTVEAHYITGGVGSLVCEAVAEHGLGCLVVRNGIGRLTGGLTGSSEYLHRAHGLTAEVLVATAQRALQATRLRGAK
ncbi:MAG: transketolase family protein [Ktedonobacterales bacterium]